MNLYEVKKLKSIEVELSSNCNAACPQCPRNNFGGETLSTLPIQNWTLQQFKQHFDSSLIRSLQEFYFCGTYGDPLMCKDIVEICKYVKSVNEKCRIGIHTNGSLRDKETWLQLAKHTDFVAFAIDGLADTNHLYRRHTSFDKILFNAHTFIKAGGTAKWDFIVFKHNQHQIEQARQLAFLNGFEEFNSKKTSRFLSRTHEYIHKWPVKNKQGQIEYALEPPSDEFLNPSYADLINITNEYGTISNYGMNVEVSCWQMARQKLYVSADGLVFPCGWLHDRMYGPDMENHRDRLKIVEMLSRIGRHKASIKHTPLKDILEGEWMQMLTDSWTNEDRMERCGIQCGAHLKLLQFQNADIDYRDQNET